MVSLLAGNARAGDAAPSKVDGTWKLTVPSRDSSAKGYEIRLGLKTDDQKIKGTAVMGRKSFELTGERMKTGELRLVARTKSGKAAMSITAKLEKDSLKGSLSQAGQTQEFTGRRLAEKDRNVLKDRQQEGLR
jgi:hypothetical protein